MRRKGKTTTVLQNALWKRWKPAEFQRALDKQPGSRPHPASGAGFARGRHDRGDCQYRRSKPEHIWRSRHLDCSNGPDCNWSGHFESASAEIRSAEPHHFLPAVIVDAFHEPRCPRERLCGSTLGSILSPAADRSDGRRGQSNFVFRIELEPRLRRLRCSSFRFRPDALRQPHGASIQAVPNRRSVWIDRGLRVVGWPRQRGAYSRLSRLQPGQRHIVHLACGLFRLFPFQPIRLDPKLIDREAFANFRNQGRLGKWR
jgi:hypothetical protein